jgi:diketogulonate reductase-like aldo/keto reductase
MEFKKSGALKIPVIGLGTWGMGGFMQADHSKDKEETEAIKSATKLGYSHIDTAELYGAGHAEELIGTAIKGLDRSKLLITSKVWPTNLQYDDVIAACKRSLNRMHIDYIDIYLIHYHSDTIPVKETMQAMDYLVENKMIKYIGVSNFSVKQLKEAQQYTKNKIIVNQIPYSLSTRNHCYISQCRNMESEIIPYCQENDIIVMAYRPIERGLLTKPHPVLDEVSKRYNKTKAQVAMNWIISKPGLVTIPKASKIEHLKENLGAAGWQLSAEDMHRLDSVQFET